MMPEMQNICCPTQKIW